MRVCLGKNSEWSGGWWEAGGQGGQVGRQTIVWWVQEGGGKGEVVVDWDLGRMGDGGRGQGHGGTGSKKRKKKALCLLIM